MKGFSFLLFIAFSISAVAQKVAATVDRNKILIGQQFHLKLQANFRQGEPLDFFEIDTLSKFEILDHSVIDTSKFSDGVALVQELTVTSWDSGKIKLGPFIMGQFQTDPIMMDVAYSPHPFDTTQPYHDVHDILAEKKPVETTWYWYLVGLLVLILLFLLFFPKGKPRAKGEFVSDESAYRKALRKLESLPKKDLDDKTFYTELVQVFREYLHKRKNIYSFSKTTDDLSVQIEKLNIDREQYSALVQTLRLSDMVKYAKYQASSQDREASVNSIRNSIVAIEQLPINNPTGDSTHAV